VIGKYLAALSLFMIMLSSTVIHVIIAAVMGGLINASTLGAYLSFILIGSLYISIGIMASAVTENQILAAAFSAVMIIASLFLQVIATTLEGIYISLASIINPLGLSAESINKAGENLAAAVNWLDPAARTSSFQSGIISVSPILFCISMTSLFLFLTYRILEKRRWSQG